ncbi:MAG: hypothetical protein EOP06_07905 [Proteobacteria bacterium]|nr:MAG: hypothetical protein EOP06_07905 [Pseudomonadota bacterium]
MNDLDILLLLNDDQSTPGTTTEWCEQRGLTYKIQAACHIQDELQLQSKGLIAFGGNMQVWDTEEYPWLVKEKALIRRYLAQERGIFGICLGAQLLAEQLGGKVSPMNSWDIGWFSAEIDDHESPLSPLHWHTSSFTLPEWIRTTARSAQNPFQGFRVSPRVVGYQFHTEIDDTRLNYALKGWESAYTGRVQTPEEIREKAQQGIPALKTWYFQQLDQWWKAISDSPVGTGLSNKP